MVEAPRPGQPVLLVDFKRGRGTASEWSVKGADVWGLRKGEPQSDFWEENMLGNLPVENKYLLHSFIVFIVFSESITKFSTAR